MPFEELVEMREPVYLRPVFRLKARLVFKLELTFKLTLAVLAFLPTPLSAIVTKAVPWKIQNNKTNFNLSFILIVKGLKNNLSKYS